MIGPVIDPHIITARHVTLYAEMAITGFSFKLAFMKMMLVLIILGCPVTLQTEIIAFFVELQAVHVVTIAAAYIMMIHLRLNERTIDIHFLINLTIRIVESWFQKRRDHRIQYVP